MVLTKARLLKHDFPVHGSQFFYSLGIGKGYLIKPDTISDRYRGLGLRGGGGMNSKTIVIGR